MTRNSWIAGIGANAQAAEIEALSARRQVELARAEQAGDDGKVAALKVELGAVTATMCVSGSFMTRCLRLDSSAG